MLGRETLGSQIRRLEGDITKNRFDQVALQHQLEEAVQAEVRGMAMVDASRAIQGRCRRMIEDKAQEISRLQDEIADLIPKPRDRAD
jgi:hypothetical protein